MKALKCKTLCAEFGHAYALHYNMKALKCKTLGTELSMRNNSNIHVVLMQAPFKLKAISLLLTLVGNGRQLNLPRGNFNDCKWPPWAMRK